MYGLNQQRKDSNAEVVIFSIIFFIKMFNNNIKTAPIDKKLSHYSTKEWLLSSPTINDIFLTVIYIHS